MKRIIQHRMLIVSALAVGLMATSCSAEQEPEPDLSLLRRSSQVFTHVARKAIPAVVFIRVEKTVEAQTRMPPGRYNDPFDFFGDDFLRRFFDADPRRGPQTRRFKQVGQGSGFLISKDGYILTNNHVVGDADKIVVKTQDGKEYEAERIGSDPKSEVAVIKIEGDDFPFLEAGNSSRLEIGEWVMAVGNPFGLTETVTVGVVSAKGRSNIGIADYEDFIQTDAAINPGNSGGPLLDIDGRVIGINTAIFSRTGGSLGIGFAIPIDMAMRIMNQLKETGTVTRGYLGVYIQEVTPDLAESFGTEESGGILISDVMADSAAEKAGLKAGDIVLEVNGHKPGSLGEFRNDIASNPPGTKLKLTVFRDGERMTLTAETEALDDEKAMADGDAEQILERIGVAISDLTPDLAARLGYRIGSGVVITEVAEGSEAASAGLRAGALIQGINHTPVTSEAEAREALASASGSAILLRVRDGRYSRFVVLGLE